MQSLIFLEDTFSKMRLVFPIIWEQKKIEEKKQPETYYLREDLGRLWIQQQQQQHFSTFSILEYFERRVHLLELQLSLTNDKCDSDLFISW